MQQENNEKRNQRNIILAALRRGEELTSLDGLNKYHSYTGFRARISELRNGIGTENNYKWKIRDKFIHPSRANKRIKIKRYFIAKEDRDPEGIEANQIFQLF